MQIGLWNMVQKGQLVLGLDNLEMKWRALELNATRPGGYISYHGTMAFQLVVQATEFFPPSDREDAVLLL